MLFKNEIPAMLKKTVNVSCVIPVLNEEQYLPILLNSIVHQDVAPREIIVADAGSRDRTVEIAKSFGCKIVPGGSVPKGRNSGGFSAIGDYILFLDADVKVPDGFLKKIYCRMELLNNVSAATVNFRPISKRIDDKLIWLVHNFLISLKSRTRKANATGACIICRRDVFILIGGFNEKIVIFEDSEFSERISKIARFACFGDICIDISVRRFCKHGRLNLTLKIFLGLLKRKLYGELKEDSMSYW